MRKIISFTEKHKGILIGSAVAICFIVCLVATMSGGSNDDYYNYTSGYGSGYGYDYASTSEFNSSIESAMLDANVAADSSIGNNKISNPGSAVNSVSTEGTQFVDTGTDVNSEVNFGDKIIYSGNIDIKSGDIPKTLSIIRDAVERNGGYITSIENGDENYGHITARVPSENFDKLVNDESIEKGNNVRRNISSQDVSLEYSDEQAELETLRIKEERILEYFKSADNIETMLRLETELQQVRSDISSSEKHLRMLDSYVSYSEVNFYINSRYTKPDEGAPFFERVRYTVEETVHFFKELTIGIVLTVIRMIPFVIYGAILFFIVKAIVKAVVRVRRKRRDKKSSNVDGIENLKDDKDGKDGEDK